MTSMLPRSPKWAYVGLLLALLSVLAITACDSPEERAQSYYEKGIKLLEKGDPVKASLEFRNALKIQQGFIPALYSLGLAQERMGQLNDAAKIFYAVTERAPDHVDSRIHLATILMMYGQTGEAIKFADQAYALAPAEARVLTLKAAIALKLDNRGDATRFADSALKLEPRNIDALVVQAGIRLVAGDPKGALAFLAKSGEAGEGNIGVQLLRMKAFDALKDKQGIEKTLVTLVKTHPESRNFKQGLVQWYLADGRTDDAERALREFAKDHPDDVQAELDVVEFLARVKNIDAAEGELVSRIAKGGNVFPYRQALAQVTLAKGNYPGAVELMRKLVAETTDSKEAATARLQLARMLVNKNDNAEAAQLVDKILADDEKNVEALILRATIRKANGQLDDAIDDLRAAFNGAPQSAEIAGLLADAYERKGAVALADEQYAKALVVEQFKPEVGLSYASFLLRYGKTDKAEKILDQLANAAPKNRQVLTLLAQVKLSRQDWVGAQKAADALRALGNSSDDQTADRILAGVLAGEKKYEESAEILEGIAAASTEGQSSTTASLVQAYLQAGKPEKAEQLLQSVLTSDPENIQARVLLGSVYRATNRTKEAEGAYKAAIEKDTKNPLGYAALGELYLGGGRSQDAEDILREGLAQQPGNNVLHLQLAMTLERAGKQDAAISEYETMFAADPRSTVVANNLASLLSEYRSDPASLERAFTIASRLKGSEVPQFLDTVGWIYYLRKDLDEALSSVKLAAEKMPQEGIYQYHLGMIYKELGQRDRATASLKKAVDLLPKESDQSAKSRAALDQLASTDAHPETKSN